MAKSRRKASKPQSTRPARKGQPAKPASPADVALSPKTDEPLAKLCSDLGAFATNLCHAADDFGGLRGNGPAANVDLSVLATQAHRVYREARRVVEISTAVAPEVWQAEALYTTFVGLEVACGTVEQTCDSIARGGARFLAYSALNCALLAVDQARDDARRVRESLSSAPPQKQELPAPATA